VLRAAETEVTALGAALLAGLAAGVFTSPEQASAGLAPPGHFEPRSTDALRHEARARWRETVARARS
jgi:glycerol kinase